MIGATNLYYKGMPLSVESHKSQNAGWLRAAVLGANDGLLSTSSLVVGIAASQQGRDAILLAGIAGMAAGALSMAAGEYVSVASQADAEEADLKKETAELRDFPEAELEELTQIYRARGLSADLAGQVARQLTAHNALEAHARDELGIYEATRARPLQAALASAAAFAAGALPPVLLALLLPMAFITLGVTAISMLLLLLLGAMAARQGGASPAQGAFRVAFWGALAMAVTAVIGRLFGAAV